MPPLEPLPTALRYRPLLLLTVGLMAGIALASWGWDKSAAWGGVAALGLLLLLAGGRRGMLGAVGILLVGAGMGAFRLAAFQARSPSDLSRWADGPVAVTVRGVIADDPQERRGGRLTCLLHAERLEAQGEARAVDGTAFVSLSPAALRGLPRPEYGDRLTLTGRLETPAGATNPGAFSWRAYLARRAVYSQLRVTRSGAMEPQGAAQKNAMANAAWAVRRRLLANLAAHLPPTQAAVLAGILIGRRTDLPPDLQTAFVHTGTVHLLATAGLHVGILTWWLMQAGRWLTLPRKAALLIVLTLLWGYALMAGGRPSVTRAVLMASLWLGASLFEREPDAPTALAAAALVILIGQPTALLEPGFQMSFLTVLTLALFLPPWGAFWRETLVPRLGQSNRLRAALWALELVGLSVGAQLGALPIVAADYNELSLSSLGANLAAVPLAFLILPCGLAGALGATPLLTLTGWGTQAVLTVVQAFGQSGWAYRALPSPPPLALVLYYAVLFVLLAALAPRPPLARPAAAAPAARPVGGAAP